MSFDVKESTHRIVNHHVGTYGKLAFSCCHLMGQFENIKEQKKHTQTQKQNNRAYDLILNTIIILFAVERVYVLCDKFHGDKKPYRKRCTV